MILHMQLKIYPYYDQSMDITLSETNSPCVVSVGRYQFGHGEILQNSFVGSRALVYVLGGRGHIGSGAFQGALSAGDVLVLPWLHDIQYRADPAEPFLVGAIHILPWADPQFSVTLRAAHAESDELHHDIRRRNVDWPNYARAHHLVAAGRQAQRISRLAQMVEQDYRRAPVPELLMRSYAALIVNWLLDPTLEDATSALPVVLERMQNYIRAHIASELSVDSIALIGRCSQATVERLFTRYSGKSAMRWVQTERMRVARELVTTTTMRVAEVAREVGYSDPFYFSRVFKRVTGLSPRAMGAGRRLL